MLSETFELRRNLDHSGFEFPESHPDVKQPGKTPGYRLGLGENGLPVTVQELDASTMSELWTHREGKHNSFPVVRVQHSLLDVPLDDPLRKQLSELKRGQAIERIKLLRAAFDRFSVIVPPHDEQLWERLREKANHLLSLFRNGDSRYQALPIMLGRFASLGVEPKNFLAVLAELLITQLELARLSDAMLAEKLLIGTIAKKRKIVRAEVPIVLDAAEDLYAVQVASPKMKGYVCRVLSTQSGGRGTEMVGFCAFNGKEQPLLKDRSPEPNLPLLGETKLFSMNRDTPCQTRYGLTGMETVPIGRQTAVELEKALKLITASDLQGRTWRGVASGKFEGSGRQKRERSDLLVVYVEGQPVISANVADLFGTDIRLLQKKFAVDAETVCKALGSIAEKEPESKLNLFLIRKVDKEKKQIVLSESPTVKEILDGARWWQLAAANVPESMLSIPARPGDNAIRVEDHVPYPDQVVRLLSGQWVENGKRSTSVEGVGLGHVLDLMLRKPGKWEPVAHHMLDLTMRRLSPLLLGVFGSRHRNDLSDWNEPSLKTSLRAMNTLGILLYAIGRRKEAYMSGTAYLVGRLLSLADTLHAEYKRVRGDKLPPRLIGNDLMSAAADNPRDAVDRLRERMMIYKAWPNQGDDKDYRLAKWAVGQMGRVCQQLSELELPSQTDQTFRAELFLGYMARPGAEEDKDRQTESHEKGE